jgi:hypothetical protein
MPVRRNKKEAKKRSRAEAQDLFFVSQFLPSEIGLI